MQDKPKNSNGMRRLLPAVAALCALALLLAAGCSGGSEYRYAEGCVWGTTYHIKYKAADDLADSIVNRMRVIDMTLSPFQPGSMVSAVNAGQGVEVDSAFAEVFRLSQRVCSLSGGLFDPTVAPLVNLWGFGYREGEADRPTPQQIDSARLTVGILDCAIADGRMLKKTPATEFNFSAVAKGYGVDQIAAMLRRNGCTDYMVEVGGEMALSGMNPAGEAWRIQVDAPVVSDDPASHTRLTTLQLTDVCIATSGNYRNNRDTSEGRVGHTISPVTGYPVDGETLSATVMAPTTALADALATAAMAMPADSARSMLRSLPGVRALLVTAGGVEQIGD